VFPQTSDVVQQIQTQTDTRNAVSGSIVEASGGLIVDANVHSVTAGTTTTPSTFVIDVTFNTGFTTDDLKNYIHLVMNISPDHVSISQTAKRTSTASYTVTVQPSTVDPNPQGSPAGKAMVGILTLVWDIET